VADDGSGFGDIPPGARAPVAGTYEQRNVLGSFTGHRVTVGQGETLPPAPRGFTWSLASDRRDS